MWGEVVAPANRRSWWLTILLAFLRPFHADAYAFYVGVLLIFLNVKGVLRAAVDQVLVLLGCEVCEHSIYLVDELVGVAFRKRGALRVTLNCAEVNLRRRHILAAVVVGKELGAVW